jgi:SAM-dependent methyltransferase
MDWDERFRSGQYPQDPDPSPLLREYVDAVPDGRALDVATGTGRNAVFLAEAGYAVDALDQSREGLRITRERARDRGVADRLSLVQTDLPSHTFPTDRYALATVSFYRAVDRFPDIKEALVDGGYLFVEHHLRSTDETPSGPSTDRYRFAANELLHACLDLTVLYYDETTEERPGDRRRASARVLARKSHGSAQSYPERRRLDG